MKYIKYTLILLVSVLWIFESTAETYADISRQKEGFYTEGRKTYYLDADGNKVTGWQQINRNGINCWHYFDDNGQMAVGFTIIDGKEYYFKEDGTLTHSCLEVIDGAIFSFNSSGTMDLGWQMIDGHWYYFDRTNGQALTGIIHSIEEDGNYYFFWYDQFSKRDGTHEKEGTLAIGNPYMEIYRDGTLYYVADSNGHVIVNTAMTVDGIEYVFDAKGRAHEKKQIFEQKVNEIKELFPVNGYWKHTGSNNPKAYNYDGSGTGNMFDNAWQCNGFAKYIFYYVYGEKSVDIYDPAENIPASKVRVGDYLRIGNNEHSIFITDIYTDSAGVQHWKVAREVWGSSNNIIKECDYKVINNTTIQYGNRSYTIDAIRRANNELRRKVGLPNANKL